MRRRLFNLAAAVSLVLCAVLCAVGVWSLRTAIRLSSEREWVADGKYQGRQWHVFCVNGKVQIGRYYFASSDPVVVPMIAEGELAAFRADGIERQTYRVFSSSAAARKPSTFGFAWEQSAGPRDDIKYSDHTWKALTVPLPALAAIFGFMPAIAWLRWRQRRLMNSRRRQARCPSCGYDLRATPGRCPECGAVHDAAARNAA